MYEYDEKDKNIYVPDKDDFDFGWRALNDGRCVLVTVAIQDLPINLGQCNKEQLHAHLKQ